MTAPVVRSRPNVSSPRAIRENGSSKYRRSHATRRVRPSVSGSLATRAFTKDSDGFSPAY